MLRARHSFNYAIYNKKYPSVDWDTWKAGWKIFMHAIDLDSNSYECGDCPEKLEDDVVEDAELEFDDIEVHTMDGVTIGNINNIVKGIPDEKLFGEKIPSDQPLQHGVEAPDRTFLKHESQRDILLRLSEKKISVDEAIKNYSTNSRRYKVPSDKHSHEVVEVLEYIKK